ncbi:MAG TPA: type II toxin-antitoxin system mRNA interferase toxin, RelE/StbE family [Flavobacterium sp.]|nr:type II toxin-antitoxin system mRNA interferase toxin, RelE/StbE family [Flavobacterium sp.]
MYELQYKKKAIKALAKINEPYYSAIIKAIDELAENPRPFGYKKLSGRSGYRIRIGTYRIIYDIFDTNLIIEIVNVGSRGGIYDD